MRCRPPSARPVPPANRGAPRIRSRRAGASQVSAPMPPVQLFGALPQPCFQMLPVFPDTAPQENRPPVAVLSHGFEGVTPEPAQEEEFAVWHGLCGHADQAVDGRDQRGVEPQPPDYAGGMRERPVVHDPRPLVIRYPESLLPRSSGIQLVAGDQPCPCQDCQGLVAGGGAPAVHTGHILGGTQGQIAQLAKYRQVPL